MSELELLSQLIHEQNRIGSRIAAIVGRPALPGHVGEFIASRIFDIALEQSATRRAIDGRFSSGPLVGRSVNVKWYGKREGILDIVSEDGPDFYLVFAGPPSAPLASRGQVRPWCVTSVHLFEAKLLLAKLLQAGVGIGVATSVRRDLWTDAEVYPNGRNGLLVVSPEQRAQLELFSPSRLV
jgi:hypothetical protein